MKRTSRFELSTTQIIMLSFLAAILAGSILLALPQSSATGEPVPYVDALFTATTATCVTGLVTLPTFSTWSIFGQAVILLLIQAGGLGIITIMAGFMSAINRKFGLRDSQLIGDSFNLNSLAELSSFVKKVLFGTLAIELAGALLYMTVFVPQFGARGIWYSVFNSVSAFCNAGIDIIADNSLCSYATNPVVNIVTAALIIIGGLGYIVWWDVIRVSKGAKSKGLLRYKSLTLHSKIVIASTAILIFAGALLIFIFEYNNPLTLKELSLHEKVGVSLFQSVTTRTAGFATVPQENLTVSTSIICILLMFIGGSPVGTAGGIKTVTAAVLFATMLSTVKGRNEVGIMNRTLSRRTTRKAVAVAGMSFLIAFISTVLLASVTEAPALDIVYEAVSATATVGLTRNLTPSLNLLGKIIIIVTMYLGRIGPISLAFAFSTRKEITNNIKDPTEEICVG